MSKNDAAARKDAAFQAIVRQMLHGESQSYEPLVSRVLAVQDVVKQAAVEALTVPLNAKLASMPAETYQDKKTLAAFVNTQLRQLGLAVRCPKTGLPGILQANPGDDRQTGRFRIEVLDSSGKRRHHSSAIELPTLGLVVDTNALVPHRSRGASDRPR